MPRVAVAWRNPADRTSAEFTDRRLATHASPRRRDDSTFPPASGCPPATRAPARGGDGRCVIGLVITC